MHQSADHPVPHPRSHQCAPRPHLGQRNQSGCCDVDQNPNPICSVSDDWAALAGRPRRLPVADASPEAAVALPALLPLAPLLCSPCATSSADRSALSASSLARTSSRTASGQRWRQGNFLLALTTPGGAAGPGSCKLRRRWGRKDHR